MHDICQNRRCASDLLRQNDLMLYQRQNVRIPALRLRDIRFIIDTSFQAKRAHDALYLTRASRCNWAKVNMGLRNASLLPGCYWLLLCTLCLCKLVSSRGIAARAGTSTILSCPIREQLYMCPIGLGMFYNPYYMIFDTGSSAT